MSNAAVETQRPLNAAMNDLLRRLDIETEAFGFCEVAPRHGLRFAGLNSVVLHYCLKGSGTLRVTGHGGLPLKAGTVAVTPTGADYAFHHEEGPVRMTDGDALSPEPAAELPCYRAGEASDAALLVACGSIAVRFAGSTCLLSRINTFFFQDDLDAEEISLGFLRLYRESGRGLPGSKALAEALIRQIMIVMLRNDPERQTAIGPWIAALSDPRLQRALDAMAQRPESRFTVDDLAAIAAMSRSAFLTNFRQAFGQTPMETLRDLRLTRAARLLERTDLSVSEISHAAGFSSRSAFSRTFKQRFGKDPSAYRAAARA